MNNIRTSCLAVLPIIALLSYQSSYAADSGTSELNIQGTAQPVCRMPGPASDGDGSNTSVQSVNITVANLINPNDATLQPWQATLRYTDVMCNYSAALRLKSTKGGLKVIGNVPTPVGGNFLTHVDYTAIATWGAVSPLVLDTAVQQDQEVMMAVTGANKADLVLQLQSPGSNLPVVEGQFQDTLTLKVGPSV
jgi:hypothetical protein